MNTVASQGMGGVEVTVGDCDNYAQQQQQQQPQQPQLEVTPTHHRLQVRRQSTLPAQPTPTIYMSTSPNRLYSRSPERSPGEPQRYPPFMRQTSFPEPPSTYHRTKLLPSGYESAVPTNPAPPLNYESQASSLASDEQDAGPMPKPRMTRQATLPNPDQHVKLLPTSPPKRQTSPQFRRSPEFMRQQTLPNPEAFTSGNTLTVHAAPPGKFMPISPRAKQNFLFPSVQNPRQFLSQPHVPAAGTTELGSGGSVASASGTGPGEQYSSSQSVNIHHSRDPHAKMIKVRSHSNEEYSNTKGHPENRRLLPEIPTTAVQRSASRSPSRLVRQDCLKEERTFGEAKQQFHQFPDVTEELENRPEYVDYFGDSATSFLESDEMQYERNYNAGFSSEPRIIYNNGSDDGSGYQAASQRPIYSAENVLADSGYGGGGVGLGTTVGSGGMPGYYPDMGTPQNFYGGAALPRTPLMHNRMRRRQSRELQMQQEELAQLSQTTDVTVEPVAPSGGSASDGHATERRKPEQMRSVSEDSGAKTTPKPVTRRSFSHPEKDTQPQQKKTEASKIPSPRPLADILDKTRGNSKIPQARRRNSRTGIGEAEEGSTPQHIYSFHQQLMHRNSDLAMRLKKTELPVATVAASGQQDESPPPNANNSQGSEQPVNGKSLESTANADDAAGAGAHTSTLGEQELQNAVEAAAVVFKKVVLQRRKEKEKEKAAEEEEAKVAAEELTRSPVIGSRQADASASPIQSRASSETWPQQSDEDIDRLVAMHQNRSSLSSLGVRSESMASVYSGAGEGRYGTVVVKGQVEFGMQYNYKLGALEIHVVRCKDLAAVDAKRNRSDPYVKVYLLPDKSKAGKRKTKVKKHTLNPIFDETMRFHTPISSLESRTLWLTVWHSDMFGRNDFLGEVSVNLQGRVFDNPQSQWYLLQERSEPFDEVATYRGDIVVGLKYIPPESLKSSFFSRGSSLTGSSSNLRKFGGSIKSVTSKSDRSTKGGQLHVLVKEAKHLSPIKANGTCDAFCKSYLLPDRTRSSKQKTPVVKRTLHPSWNYTFVYEDVSLEDLSERALELTVWDHDRLASNEFVGGIRFSLGTGRSYGRQVEWMDATGKELSLWQNMLDRPNFWVEGSLVLRSSLDGIRATLP
ncbi:synaptotagmin-like protein 5 isoform X4 [Drosophila serrata]|uniref:synaptotagmin-like protein 5 isoform X4 n=1 Tax=Drosophila serrata TaxID=7274 RepID=UPI000A1D2AF7|nr:synaptotagmin-like protein 5 isoform X4 [Drosophila serrata]